MLEILGGGGVGGDPQMVIGGGVKTGTHVTVMAFESTYNPLGSCNAATNVALYGTLDTAVVLTVLLPNVPS